MKVNIGPYVSWWGPYQIADLLQHVGVSEDTCYKIGEWLSNTWVCGVCEWVHSKLKRKIDVRIDPYDTWSVDHTLSIIILPMLKQLHATKHGAPNVDDKDVPKELRSTSAPKKENSWDTDDNHFKRWDWVMEEMIFAFEHLVDDEWEEKFSTGTSDYMWVDKDNGFTELVKGPNHTRVTDYDGLKAVHKRIDNGLVLFGKYYRNLWD